MNCKHEKTRKLFWLDQKKGKWIRTENSKCLTCGEILSHEVKITNVKSITEALKDAEDDLRDCVAKGENSKRVKIIKKKLGLN